ncbi:MAG: molybdopterin-binding/glycosyltransferase family 2 protein [Mesorhizobium sp.]|nr:molybdopterin-binding/glycosyltransferase family 2 protein [Mesorhizobium sp.]MBL8576099.1 molybdopterin-binding/glycosyltransferase family 2 protein [Mesorhizobium sp.]
MKFGPVALAEAEGALLAHAVAAGEKLFRKAHCLTAEDVVFLREAGIAEVVAAVLSSDDIDENAAATRVVTAMRFGGIEAKPATTGRVNLYAKQAGLFTVDRTLVDRLNALDPSITLATIVPYKPVRRGDMVATVKIIPFAVDRTLVDRAASLLSSAQIFAVLPFRSVSAGFIQTVLPGLKESVLAKSTRVMAARLARSGSTIAEEMRIGHDAVDLAEAMSVLSERHDMVIVFGASALCDFDDVIPSAIRRAGGAVLRAGMPVDPGNLLVLGRLNGKPVIGAPGCARSPKENGFDWVLDRLIAGLDVTDDDIAGMGVGGLLMEIPTRPQPREASLAARPVDVHAVILAAGRSSRMGGPNKLMAHFSGRPLIRQTVERAQASLVRGAVVVTGHQAERVNDALDGLDLEIVRNPDFASGLSSSLKAGIAALPPTSSGALILLGDMPAVSAADMNRLVSEFRKAGGKAIVRATHDGKRGNPVILPRALFGQVSTLEGDTGARHLVESGLAEVIDVEIGAGASIDVDTQDALESAGGVLQD